MLTDAEKAQMEVEFVGKNGQRRKLEVCAWLHLLAPEPPLNRLPYRQMIMGRQKLKKSLQYEVKWRGARRARGKKLCILTLLS